MICVFVTIHIMIQNDMLEYNERIKHIPRGPRKYPFMTVLVWHLIVGALIMIMVGITVIC